MNLLELNALVKFAKTSPNESSCGEYVIKLNQFKERKTGCGARKKKSRLPEVKSLIIIIIYVLMQRDG